MIGNFDGVHRGHRAVLSSAITRAEASSLAPVLLTFDPHPSVVLGKATGSALTTLDRRVELLHRVAPTLTVVVQPFTLALSELSAREFVEQLLLDQLGAASVVVGQNFCFGRGRSGDIAVLSALGAELGFDAAPHALEGDADGVFSSSRVRALLLAGDVAAAAQVLGRPHSISGTVVAGDARGRSIGFPTANFGGVEELLPGHGVYACVVDRLDAHGRAAALGLAVANLGVRPTLGAGASIEAHLLDFSGDLYGTRLRLHFVARIRDEQRFAGVDDLIAQIARDVATARQLLSTKTPDAGADGAWA